MNASPEKWWESWWFGSIVIGLGINILSSYLKPLLDQWWGKYSEQQRIKNQFESAIFNQRVEEMLADQTDYMEVLARLVISYIGGIIALVICFGGLLFPSDSVKVAFLLVGSTTMILQFRASYKINLLLSEYRKRRKLDQANKFIDSLFGKDTTSMSPEASSGLSPQSSAD